MICMIKKAQQELAAAFLWNLPYHLWHTHALKHTAVAWTCKRFLSFTSQIQKLSLKYFHFSSFFSKSLLSQVNSGSCAGWNSEAGNICSVTTLDKLFQVFFQFLEDAMQIPKPPGIITLLSLTPLNLAISVCKYWITAHHTPLRQAITSHVNRQGTEAQND